ncbi:hypothetical protein KXD40_000222 [Peronospora effusa]|uniref:Uncharacterized protein n=1 Tax=Peronospora effusa TaxID=542832 RepID=A0A3M6VGS5_9STRA|nr:hypothetical protein DD238_002912 [Peronospora effusa]RQM14933.1 hypothetical protein DD237_003330 [Peronospora effusa]UIZ21686.1 hypothetical protein KXD40_000222 [Peronospora effusa]
MLTEQVFGMGTRPLLRYFGLTSTQEEDRELDEYVGNYLVAECTLSFHAELLFYVVSSSEDANQRLLSGDEEHDADTSFRPIAQSPSRQSISGIHGIWERLDENYLKPLFGGQPREKQHQSKKNDVKLNSRARTITKC